MPNPPNTPLDAIVAGHLCLDIIPDLSANDPEQFRRAFVPGRLVMAGDATISTGGPVSNVGLALHKLGMRVQLMAKVGDDLFGQVIRQIVDGHGPGLAKGLGVDPITHSSYSLVISPPGIDRYFIYFPGANDTFCAADVDQQALGQARLLHFGYPPLLPQMLLDRGAQLADTLRRAKASGITTSLDMTMPDPTSPAGRADWSAILGAALPHVDIFLPSIEEILFTLWRDRFDALEKQAGGHSILPLITPQILGEVSQALMDMGPAIVGLKLGDRGLYVRTAGQIRLTALGRAAPIHPATWADRELWSPCFQVHVVGTVGSGDATIAGFLTALLRDFPPEEAVNAAVAVGACNVEAADTLGGIRSWADTLDRVAAGWAKHPMQSPASGWRWDEAHEMWCRANIP